MDHSIIAPRVDLYAFIHKALRTLMCHTLVAVGSADAGDAAEVEATLAQVRDLTSLCATHVMHENTFVHTAMEARAPGSSAATSQEHAHHSSAIDRLNALADSVAQASGPARATALNRLYRSLAVFVADNLVHMEEEESANNTVLWATHTDEELLAIEGAIHQVIQPQEMALCMRWMLPGLNAGERAGLLADIRKNAPEPVFEGVLGIARQALTGPDFAKIDLSLAQPLAA